MLTQGSFFTIYLHNTVLYFFYISYVLLRWTYPHTQCRSNLVSTQVSIILNLGYQLGNP